jgi:two-component system sensor histidine kinase KdpD
VWAEHAQLEQEQLLQATEMIQSALLNSISHNLRTPLVSIQGALTWLQEDSTHLDNPTRQNLIEIAVEETDRLNHFIDNLLDMARAEAHTIKIVLEPYDVEYVISSALAGQNHLLKDRGVNVAVPNGLPFVPMDFALMVKVLAHLLDNAIKYSAPGMPIDVQASLTGGHLEIAVADRGVGIPPADLTRVFDKFYRVLQPNSVLGLGLGLAICKGLVEAHGGSIKVENRTGGGTVVTLSLPLIGTLCDPRTSSTATAEVIESD